MIVYNTQVANHAVAILLNQLNQLIDGLVQFRVLGPGIGLRTVILNGNGIGKLTVGQYLSIPVVNLSTGAGH